MSVSAGTDQRTRIIETALALMGEQGAAETSMRQLAGACGINVATKIIEGHPSTLSVVPDPTSEYQRVDRCHNYLRSLADSIILTNLTTVRVCVFTTIAVSYANCPVAKQE